MLEPPGEQADRVRLEAGQQLAGQRRAAAAAGAARERADGLGRRDLGREQAQGTITRSAPGCTRTVAGRSAIGSPSACTLNGRSAWKATSRARTISTPGSCTWAPVKTFGSGAEVLALGDVADHHDVQHAVVELGLGGEEHPAAEHAGVADGDGVARERARLAVDHDLPARRPPRAHGAQRGVEVDELAELAAASRWRGRRRRSRGRRRRCRGRRGRRCRRRRRRCSRPSARTSQAATGSWPSAELAREVVAAAAGQHREHAVGAAQLAGDRAQQPVAAHRRGQLARRERRARELAGVLDRVRALDPEGDPAPAQRRLDGRQQPRRPAAARARVDDEADGRRAARRRRLPRQRGRSRHVAWA